MPWKLAQFAIWLGLTVFYFEVIMRPELADGDPGTQALAVSALIALVLTSIIFAPFLWIQMWRDRRRSFKQARSHKRLQ